MILGKVKLRIVMKRRGIGNVLRIMLMERLYVEYANILEDKGHVPTFVNAVGPVIKD